jgi:RNA polymerase sigma factor (sigma-70 family)
MASAAPEVSVLACDAAFERMYRRHVQDVYRYTLALLRNPADAEDVTQTTFMKAFRAMQRGEQPRKPQNWLIKIAHNAARTRYARTMRRVREVPLDGHVETIQMPDDEQPDLQEVLDALGRLPLNQRAALVMRELEGRSYAEIADTIGVSVPAVETLIFRARRSLRLKASNLRVLGLAPLPQSLAQLCGGGAGAVSGGTAALGSGLALKAAVAVVAGALATGLAVGRHDPAADAASGARPKAAGPAASKPSGDRVSSPARVARSGRSKGGPGTARPPRHEPAVEIGGAPAVGTAPGDPASSGVAGAGATARVEPAAPPQPAHTVATTVENTVQQVTDSVPVVVNQVVSSLPVTVPEVPPPAPPPALPALPPVPSVPALPQVPQLPQLPGLP